MSTLAHRGPDNRLVYMAIKLSQTLSGSGPTAYTLSPPLYHTHTHTFSSWSALSSPALLSTHNHLIARVFFPSTGATATKCFPHPGRALAFLEPDCVLVTLVYPRDGVHAGAIFVLCSQRLMKRPHDSECKHFKQGRKYISSTFVQLGLRQGADWLECSASAFKYGAQISGCCMGHAGSQELTFSTLSVECFLLADMPDYYAIHTVRTMFIKLWSYIQFGL